MYRSKMRLKKQCEMPVSPSRGRPGSNHAAPIGYENFGSASFALFSLARSCITRWGSHCLASVKVTPNARRGYTEDVIENSQAFINYMEELYITGPNLQNRTTNSCPMCKGQSRLRFRAAFLIQADGAQNIQAALIQ
jgi:hypothetical protein